MPDAGAPITPPNHEQASLDQAGFALEGGAIAAAASTTGAGYRVLARKYRPATFDDLIGQEAMVRTLSNAFETGRIPQAWILTGVRGVGKTTTARILARALNYELPDGSVKGPTIHMPVPGVHCQAIMESRHIDILEMDAASHTGIDDVRQITDGVRYAPSSARYKVYIIDEVHMLSEKAFNAFLKTLEEPPEHAKFVFATTEIRKVPVTVLSRCQRFDLRRVETDVLMAHLANISTKEGVQAEPEALGLIARAAEGSVRDSLSLLDQAIAHAAGLVRAEDVRQMLGLADRTRIIDLFQSLASGDIAAAFKEFRDQYDTGADPVVVLSDLAEFVNFVTRVKIVPATADNLALGETERTRGRDFAAKLSMRVLSRMWQMLLKGITEVKDATRPQAAAEMVLVRIAYAADLPTPDEAIRMIEQNGGSSPALGGNSGGSAAPRGISAMHAPAGQNGAPLRAVASTPTLRSGGDSAMPARMSAPAPAPTPVETIPVRRLDSFAELVALAGEKRDLQIKAALE
ncbi:MAG: DNA polymerase III subunit gamma/tau, partial [Afipia sp.]|nr:DNA polymerase III subunit gamma/tau [Afipia sp.]